MSISGSWCLIISGNQIDFDEIRDKIGIAPSRITRRGDIKSKVIGPSQYDIWMLERNFESSNEVVTTLDELLSALQSHESYINNLTGIYNVSMRFYIQSDFAQIGVSLPPHAIKKLAVLNVKIEISILSWGGVEDDGASN